MVLLKTECTENLLSSQVYVRSSSSVHADGESCAGQDATAYRLSGGWRHLLSRYVPPTGFVSSSMHLARSISGEEISYFWSFLPYTHLNPSTHSPTGLVRKGRGRAGQVRFVPVPGHVLAFGGPAHLTMYIYMNLFRYVIYFCVCFVRVRACMCVCARPRLSSLYNIYLNWIQRTKERGLCLRTNKHSRNHACWEPGVG